MSAQRVIRAVVVGWLAVGGGLLAQEKPEQMAQRSDEAWLERVDASSIRRAGRALPRCSDRR